MDRPIITFTTDFGTSDGFVGAMKGVVLGICPGARIVDITHDIHPQDIMEAALILDGAVPFFPPGTIHVVVVDPGVGSDRRAVALACPDFCLVGPDNGVFSPLWERARECHTEADCRAVELTEGRYHLDEISTTFHGRDIFSPVAAHLGTGVGLDALGPPVDDLVSLALPRPVVDGRVISGEVIHVDRFGNCITNIPQGLLRDLSGQGNLSAEIGVEQLGPVRGTYSDVAEMQALALVGSFGRLEAALRNGSLARTRGYVRGTRVRVRAE